MKYIQFFLTGAIVVVAVLSLSFTITDDVLQDTPWVVPDQYVNMKNPVAADGQSISIGKSLYNLHCKSCHGKEGLGDGPKAAQLETPSGDFTSDSFIEQTDGSLFYKTREGRGDMPAFDKKIPVDEDIWHIVNYIRTFE